MHMPFLLEQNLSNNRIIQVYTYGAPKPVRAGRETIKPGVLYRRVFQNLDPVPSLPITSTDFSSLWAYVGVPTARSWSRWHQPITGLNTGGVTTLTPSNNPTLPATPTLYYLSLLNWVVGGDAFGADAHSLASYTQAVASLQPAERPTSSPHTSNLPTPLPPATRQMTLARAEEIASIAAGVNANPADAAQGIITQVERKPGVRYRGAKIQGEQWVLYGDQPISPTRTLRTRRALVRYLNRQL